MNNKYSEDSVVFVKKVDDMFLGDEGVDLVEKSFAGVISDNSVIRPEISPKGKGLVRETKKSKACKEAGKKFEKELVEFFMKLGFVVLYSLIFREKEYRFELGLYAYRQIDIIIITSVGVFVIEAKFFSDNNCTEIIDAKVRKGDPKWKVKGKRVSQLNGYFQNEKHCTFIRELLREHGSGHVPVYNVPIIGGVSENKIKVSDEVFTKEQALHFIKAKCSENREVVDVNQVRDLIEEFTCKDEDAELKQEIYAKFIQNGFKAPKRIKKYVDQLYKVIDNMRNSI